VILQSEFDQASILLIGRLIINRQNAEEKEDENLIAYMLDDGVLLWRLLPFKFPARNKNLKKSLYGVVQPCDTVVLIESIPSAVCVYPPGI
jgi:hypothetical protein